MKDKIVLLLLGIFVICFSSCLGNDDDDSGYIPSGDAQVYYFHLQNDSIPALDSVKFTIDQLNGKIYNPDSMAYGTVINGKAVCTFTTRGVAGIQVRQTALSDTLSWWNTTDSLDFTKPVEFIVTPMDGIHKKPYTAWINIHTVNPDSMAWRRVAHGIYPPEVADNRSVPVQTVILSPDSTQYWMFVLKNNVEGTYMLRTAPIDNVTDWKEVAGSIVFSHKQPGILPAIVRLDQLVRFGDALVVPEYKGQYRLFKSIDGGMSWSTVKVNGTDLYIRAVMGVLNMPRQSGYLCIVGGDTDKYFYRTSDLETWERSETSMSADFPDGGGFARLAYQNMYHPYLLLVGGWNADGTALLNTVWNTSDGLNWVKYESTLSPFDQGRQGAMLTQYDGKFYLIGGTDINGQTTRNIMYSVDRGLSWKPVDDLKAFPDDYTPRSFASVHVDKENNLLLFGGRESASSAWLDEIWSGRINRLGFAGAGN